MKYNLKKLVKEALTCDKNCGHTLKDTNACFEHQCERVKDLINGKVKINPLRKNCYERLVSKQLKDLGDKVNELVEEFNKIRVYQQGSFKK